MPGASVFTVVIGIVKLLNKNEAGPAIFDHSHLVMLPSRSVDALPSKATESEGKWMMVSLPALAIGGLLVCRQFSQDNSRLQEFRISKQNEKQITRIVAAFMIFGLIIISIS